MSPKTLTALAAATACCAALAQAPAPAAAPAPAPAAPAAAATAKPLVAWNRDAYVTAMKASGRPHDITPAGFDAIQKRKDGAMKSIRRYLDERFGKADPAVLQAFSELPREYFHYQYAERTPMAAGAYEAEAKPWAIGYGSALSDYLGQAYMTQAAQPKPTDVVLEIGTGSGYQAAALSRIVRKVYSIEIIEPLGKAVGDIFKPIGIDNVSSRVGDGFFGWPEVESGFDIIIVTCAAQYVPPALFKQLRPGGRMLIPIGQPFKRGQFLFIYTKDAEGKVSSRKDVGVFFIPMTGTMMKTPKPAEGAPAAAPGKG